MNEMTTAAAIPPPPDGYQYNRQGNLVRIENIKAQDQLEDETVRSLMAEALQLHDTLGSFRVKALEHCDEFVDLLRQDFKATRGGKRGGYQLDSMDGLMRITIAVGDTMSFGGTIQVARELIEECFLAWGKTSNVNLVTIVNSAFKVDKKGNLSVEKIMALRQHEIDDATWRRAMDAIDQSIRVHASKRYVRFYTRPNWESTFVQLPLAMAALGQSEPADTQADTGNGEAA